tara:strand:- start:112 stop:231 length:120 start_codon:yes stop_codon:yes gene_type:complete
MSDEKMRELYAVWKTTRPEEENYVVVRKSRFTALLSRNS